MSYYVMIGICAMAICATLPVLLIDIYFVIRHGHPSIFNPVVIPQFAPMPVLDGLMLNKAVYLHKGLGTAIHDRAIAKRLRELPSDERMFLADEGPEFPV